MRCARTVYNMTTSAATVGHNIRAEMTRLQLTQEDVAQMLGVSQSGVSRRLIGEIAFNVVELTTLARMFDVTASYLLGENAET